MNWATPAAAGQKGDRRSAYLQLQELRRRDRGRRHHGRLGLPLLRQSHRPHRTVCRGLRPDLIIPFKLDKKAAKAKLQEHLKGKTLLPRVFRSQNHIDEIKGVYVPFWLFDSDADASCALPPPGPAAGRTANTTIPRPTTTPSGGTAPWVLMPCRWTARPRSRTT